MKAKLTFNLPEEQSDFRCAVNGVDWMSVCWDMDQWLRSELKYNDSKYSDKEYELLEKVREELNNKMIDHGVSFYDNI
jgi:hypothetical protein